MAGEGGVTGKEGHPNVVGEYSRQVDAGDEASYQHGGPGGGSLDATLSLHPGAPVQGSVAEVVDRLTDIFLLARGRGFRPACTATHCSNLSHWLVGARYPSTAPLSLRIGPL